MGKSTRSTARRKAAKGTGSDFTRRRFLQVDALQRATSGARQPGSRLWPTLGCGARRPGGGHFVEAMLTVVSACRQQSSPRLLDRMPKRLQPRAKKMLHEVGMADTRENANKAFDQFVATYEAKYPKPVGCLSKDRDVLLAFYDFPAEHWIHLRTTNQRGRYTNRVPDHGLQADAARPEKMEISKRLRTDSRCDSRNPLRRWNQTAQSSRLRESSLKLPYTTLGKACKKRAAWSAIGSREEHDCWVLLGRGRRVQCSSWTLAKRRVKGI